jgi:hypothetical protein
MAIQRIGELIFDLILHGAAITCPGEAAIAGRARHDSFSITDAA